MSDVKQNASRRCTDFSSAFIYKNITAMARISITKKKHETHLTETPKKSSIKLLNSKLLNTQQRRKFLPERVSPSGRPDSLIGPSVCCAAFWLLLETVGDTQVQLQRIIQTLMPNISRTNIKSTHKQNYSLYLLVFKWLVLKGVPLKHIINSWDIFSNCFN